MWGAAQFCGEMEEMRTRSEDPGGQCIRIAGEWGVAEEEIQQTGEILLQGFNM